MSVTCIRSRSPICDSHELATRWEQQAAVIAEQERRAAQLRAMLNRQRARSGRDPLTPSAA